ncbi:hypothetical protein HEQ62_10715 [Haematospirillum jordaniae]|uniref:Uncharacterized protein n=1 Tax=Haematospirillum jordaniae TaxID=1549855 RepID=A0A143DHE0_9PROT|nr:hypothetical protein [Haematospirillum jordaniae]AMW35763.1 hypothetical protein AY555_10295 [Haematospirillum jordaniae]AMW35957.1 hypothetical protein AY555_11410 [Haematospirillum jordaniae]NKD46227.1 hypothetical protein [Haematospirillum jordaniae]NKD58130.1 hypothetical protein [Haematospirillum jordaniae]NKD60239.1 hypothetical protein [Haematospirillum jordaniae]
MIVVMDKEGTLHIEDENGNAMDGCRISATRFDETYIDGLYGRKYFPATMWATVVRKGGKYREVKVTQKK